MKDLVVSGQRLLSLSVFIYNDIIMNPKERWDEVFKQGKDFTTLNDIFIDEELLPRLTPKEGVTPRTLLDVGCGTGDVLMRMQKRGFDVTGIDASSEAVRIARERTGLDEQSVVEGDIDALGLDKFHANTYDLITNKLVIAFIKDKKVFLKNIHDLLSENGQLLLITPLLYSGTEYIKPHTRGIAVDVEIVGTLLNEQFSSVNLFHKDFMDDNGVLGYYLCEK